MTQNGSSDFNNEDKTDRFRRIRTTPEEEEVLPPLSAPASSPTPRAGAKQPSVAAPEADSGGAPSALARLQMTQHRKSEAAAPVESPEEDSAPRTRQSFRLFNRKRQPDATESQPAVSTDGEVEPAPPSRQWRFAPAFWTIASTLSLIVNIILMVIILLLLNTVSKLNLQLSDALKYASLPEDTVKGLYENFVKMDNAHIRRNIPVSLEVPVKFDITINTQTEVVLSQDTPISQARVTLTTGGLNITNAPANIVLPAGTRLPINLSLVVPVDKTVPVSLVVQVDIPLNETDLHDPFTGLQTVVQPLYCLLDPKATSSAGILLCPPPATP